MINTSTSSVFDNLAKADFNSVLRDGEAPGENIPTPYELNNLACHYWNTENLSEHIVETKSDLYLHFNIQNLPTKFDNLLSFLNVLSCEEPRNVPPVLALSETWLTTANVSSFPITGYHPIIPNIRKDNSGRGGVALYVREDLNFNERPDLDLFIPFIFESKFITIKEFNITTGVIYRSPSANISDFLQAYQQLIEKLKLCKEHYLLLGDFNIDLLDYHSDITVSEFVNINFEAGNIPLITKPTRISDNSASCIDNIITDHVINESFAGVLIEDISDHLPVFYSIKRGVKTHVNKPSETTRIFRNLSEANILKLNNLLANTDWSSIISDTNPSTAAKSLNDILTNLLDSTCPHKTTMKKKTPNVYQWSQNLFEKEKQTL